MKRMIFANSLSFYSNLIDHCLCVLSANSVHAQLIKVGLNNHTFLGNRILHLYSTCGNLSDSLRVFQDISSKNSHTWNIFLKGYLKFGFLEDASFLFRNMPGKDIVSWNMMISGYATYGYIKSALGTFIHMQEAGVRPSEFTFSILLSFMSCSFYGKQIHCYMLRYGIYLSNVVLGNSLIGMYGKLGLTDCALSVFLAMEDRDVISWNTLIRTYYKSGNVELALSQFHLMRNAGYSPDDFTMSTVIAACSELGDIGKSGQICALCFKMGAFSNMIVSSAAIDMFSKCHMLKDSLRLFQEIDRWNPAVCNSMISCYASHGFWEDAFRLFVLAWRSNVNPSEFTVSSLLSSVSVLFSVDIGSQIHSVAVKLGLVLDDIVASSLMEMYSKYGCIDSMKRIFCDMSQRDLISWNTMILGLARSGHVVETLDTFKELLEKGPPPDRITLAGVLLACSYGGLVCKGKEIFFSMEEEYGVIPRDEHYSCIIDLLSQAGKVGEALDVIKEMPHEANTSIWKSILYSCEVHGNLTLTEMVAERLMELEPTSSLPYLVLFRIYEMRGKLGSMVRVLKVMKERSVKKVTGCCSIGIKNHVVAFYENELLNSEFKEIYLLLRLLTREVEDFSDVRQHFHMLDALGE